MAASELALAEIPSLTIGPTVPEEPGPVSTIKLRLKRQNDKILVRALITHPMETGRRTDPESGQILPAHYITQLRLEHNGRIVADCQLSTAVSRDPYFAFRLKDTKPGDRVKLIWTDNRGSSDSAEATIE